MAVQATSSQQSSFPNAEMQEPSQAPSPSTLQNRINPLETGRSGQFWEEREVELFGRTAVQQLSEVPEKKDIKMLLDSYYSSWSIRSKQQDILFYVTTSSDLGNGRLPQNKSEWTLKIHDPEMKRVIAECKMRSPITYDDPYKQYKCFYIIDIRNVEGRDYIIVPVAESLDNATIYDVFCFDRKQNKLTRNIGSVNNPIFMKNYLVSWRSVDPLRNGGVHFATYTLQGHQLAEQFVEDCCDISTNDAHCTIHFGSPKHPAAGDSWIYCSDIYGTIEENPAKNARIARETWIRALISQKLPMLKGTPNLLR